MCPSLVPPCLFTSKSERACPLLGGSSPIGGVLGLKRKVIPSLPLPRGPQQRGWKIRSRDLTKNVG